MKRKASAATNKSKSSLFKKWRVHFALSTLLVVGVVAILLLAGGKKADAPAPLQQLPVYVAMGDSVAAGLGLEDPSDSSACGRTNQAYPSLVAQKISADLKSIACSGATIQSGLAGSQNVNDLAVAPQVDQFAKLGGADYVTITIGANDIGWSRVITKCFTGSCGTDQDKQASVEVSKNMRANLRAMLDKLKALQLSKPPKVVLTGYYDVLPTSTITACETSSGITDYEAKWIKAEVAVLNSQLAVAALPYDFVRFAKVSFGEEHLVCGAGAPWVQGLDDRAPFHPTADGQKAIAEAVAAEFENWQGVKN